MREGRPFLKFFLYIFNNEQKGRFVDASRGGTVVIPLLNFFNRAMLCDVETISFHRGIEPPRCDHYGFFLQNHFAGIRRFRWVCFML